jgi:hypothetical protein
MVAFRRGDGTIEQMKPNQRLKLVDILVDNFTADELRNLVYAILGAGVYETLQGSSKRGRVVSLLERLESADQVGELIDFLREHQPDIELPDSEVETEPDLPEQPDDTDVQEHTEASSSSIRRQDQTTPKYSEELRRRRPGYDRVRKLVEEYDRLTADEIGRMSEADLTDTYLQPLFEALGWSVRKGEPLNAVRGFEGSRVYIVDLLLSYRDLRVLAEAKKPGEPLGEQADDQLFRYLYQTRNSWGFLTNFETIRILDLKDVNRSTLLLETGPRLYVTDDDDKHDLLAAAVFYSRFAPRSTQPQPIQSLIQSLEDKNDSVRQAAIERLGEIGDPQAVEHLIPILEDFNESIRLAAVAALGAIGDPRAIQDLSRLQQDANDSIRLAAVEAIGKIERSQPEKEQTDNLAEQVKRGALPPGIALDQALQIPNPALRVRTLLGLIPHLPAPLREEAIARALEQEIEDAELRVQVFEGVAPYLPEDAQERVQAEIRAARAETMEARSEAERRERIEIAVRALADSPSDVDLLGFSDYAKALADFIRSEKTEKPLTIGIDAAWGMGKTTLMHMVRKQLIEPQKGKQGVSFLTVWFNAWKYDQEESLWAALALEILDQVKKQSGWWKRLHLWFLLNHQRLDRALLWRSVLKLLASALGVYLIGALIFGIIALWLGVDVFVYYFRAVGPLSAVAAMYAAGKEIYDRLAGPFDLKLGEYIRKPDYKERIGFLAEFEEDFQRVVKAVTRDGKWPLVVFIDDLDRCAPPKPAEIIEAINILLGAKHCVFVVGMDAQAVACSIEAKYQDLCERLDDADDPGGLTLGQRFLEKIVQINFRIPKADSKLIESFVDANLGLLSEEPSEKPREEEARSEAEQLIEAEQRAGKPLDEAVEVVKAARPDMSQETVTEARQEVFARSFDDSEEVKRAIYEAVPYLECNPRKIKRFINVFRLRALIANRRGLLEGGVIRLDLLAKWMIVAMRWPDFARAVSDDENWIASLVEAYDIQGKLIGPGALLADDPGRENAQSRLDSLLADPGVKRWVDADDLAKLLKGITTQTGWNLSNYAQLAQTVSEGSYTAGVTGLS